MFIIDLIEEIITEDNERLVASLPGPPRPPDNLLCTPQAENNRRLRQSSSPSSQPVLVARGTACQVSGISEGWLGVLSQCDVFMPV